MKTELAPTPEEEVWIKQMQRLLRKKPRTIALFGCEDGLVALRAGPDGQCPLRPGLRDPNAPSVDGEQILAILTQNCEGGAW